VGFLIHMVGVPGKIVAIVFVALGLLVLMIALAVITMPIAVFMRYYGNNVYDVARADATGTGGADGGGVAGAPPDEDVSVETGD